MMSVVYSTGLAPTGWSRAEDYGAWQGGRPRRQGLAKQKKREEIS